LVWHYFFFASGTLRFGLAFLLLRFWTSRVWFGIPSLRFWTLQVWFGIPFSSLLELSGLVWHSFFFIASGPLRFGLAFLLFASRPNRFGLAFLLLLRFWNSQIWFGIPSSSLLDLSGLVWHSFSSLLDLLGLVWHSFSLLLDLTGLVWHSFFFTPVTLRFGLAFLLLLRLWTSQVWFGIPSSSSPLDLLGLVWHSFFFFASGPLRFGLAFLLLLLLWTSQVWFVIISPSLLEF
jgi:hypothetical protein